MVCGDCPHTHPPIQVDERGEDVPTRSYFQGLLVAGSNYCVSLQQEKKNPLKEKRWVFLLVGYAAIFRSPAN